LFSARTQHTAQPLLKKDLEEKGKKLHLCGGLYLRLWLRLRLWGRNSHGT